MPAARRTELTGAAATWSAVLAGLAGHDWVHAACHGTQDLAGPGTGGLVPYDWQRAGTVSITDIAGHHPRR